MGNMHSPKFSNLPIGVVWAALFLIFSSSILGQDFSLETITNPAWSLNSFNHERADILIDLLLKNSGVRPVDQIIDGDEYIVGPGDHFSIRFISDDLQDIGCRIESDGTLFIKTVGSIAVPNITLNEALQIIKTRLEKYYSPGEYFIQFTGFRVCRIHVQGQVKKPGVYLLPANWRVSEAIDAAGGLTAWADPEKIEISGLGQEKIANLNEYTSKGSLTANPMVCVGNHIVIPARNLTYDGVSVEGAVNNPGEYSLNDKELTVKQLLEKCGGIANGGDTNQITIFRRVMRSGEPSEEFRKFSKSQRLRGLSQFLNQQPNSGVQVIAGPRRPENPQDLVLQAGDSVYIPYSTGMVYVYGTVLSPGAVSYRAGQMVGYYIDQAGGYGGNAAIGIILANQVTGQVIKASREIIVLDGETIFVSDGKSDK